MGDDIFLVEDLGNNRIKLIPAPTHVSEPGTPVNKALLQPIEDYLASLNTGGLTPPGGIIMWSGSIGNIPSGWALCDGSNGTPDLRDRFIVGAGGSYNVGSTGGANSVALNTNQMPPHNHGAGNLNADTAGSHSHEYRTAEGTKNAGGVTSGYLHSVLYRQTSREGAHTHTVSGSTASAGGGQAHENRPPYYALCFIMKL